MGCVFMSFVRKRGLEMVREAFERSSKHLVSEQQTDQLPLHDHAAVPLGAPCVRVCVCVLDADRTERAAKPYHLPRSPY